MISRDDLLRAKRVLAANWLRRGVEAQVVGRRAVVALSAATSRAATNVHAVGIGRKLVDGKPTGAMAVRLYVIQKLPASLLSREALVPQAVEGVPTDVIESPPAFATLPPKRRGARKGTRRSGRSRAASSCSDNRQQKERPVVAGVSIAHFAVTAGTLGYFCRAASGSALMMLSNNHVLANVNAGVPGDAIYQPGPADGGQRADQVGVLTRFVPISLGGSTANAVDCAVGELDPSIGVKVELCTIGPITGTVSAVEGDKVRKHGRTTGYTEGAITDESYDVLIGMDHQDAGVVALFENQLRVGVADGYRYFGLGGDSGSLVVMKTSSKAAGLYFAGPSDGSYGVANPINAVLDALKVSLA